VRKLAIPVLHVTDSSAAEAFYSNQLGFRRQFVYRADETSPDPCSMGFSRDGARLHAPSFIGEQAGGVRDLAPCGAPDGPGLGNRRCT
jgi:hypothetical protein